MVIGIAQPLTGQLVEIGRVDQSTITAELTKSEVINHPYQYIGRTRGSVPLGWPCRDRLVVSLANPTSERRLPRHDRKCKQMDVRDRKGCHGQRPGYRAISVSHTSSSFIISSQTTFEFQFRKA